MQPLRPQPVDSLREFAHSRRSGLPRGGVSELPIRCSARWRRIPLWWRTQEMLRSSVAVVSPRYRPRLWRAIGITALNILHRWGLVRIKFGGFRLDVAGWPVDIWNATDTWAIRQGFVAYKSIASLTETTVLNWDAILMNWRTGAFICKAGYLEDLRGTNVGRCAGNQPQSAGRDSPSLQASCSKEARRVTRRPPDFLPTQLPSTVMRRLRAKSTAVTAPLRSGETFTGSLNR